MDKKLPKNRGFSLSSLVAEKERAYIRLQKNAQNQRFHLAENIVSLIFRFQTVSTLATARFTCSPSSTARHCTCTSRILTTLTDSVRALWKFWPRSKRWNILDGLRELPMRSEKIWLISAHRIRRIISFSLVTNYTAWICANSWIPISQAERTSPLRQQP